MTPYNIRQNLARGATAGQQLIKDPGAGGTVNVYPGDLVALAIKTTGARTLQAAAQIPLGTRVLATSSVASASVNGQTLNAGESAEFTVTLDSSGNNQWQVGTVLS